MKTLIIAPFLDGTGYGKAAEAIAEAASLQTDTMCFALKLGQNQFVPSKVVQELLQKQFTPDVILQVLTPNFFVGPGVGWWFQESRGQGEAAGWSRNRSYVEDWVSGPFPHQRRMLVPTDLLKYNREYPQPLPKSDVFRFYYIGDVGRRKNIIDLIKAWILAFNRDSVELVLKVPHHAVQAVQKMIGEIVDGAKINSSHIGRILIEGRPFLDEEIYGLHQQCDCFITLSHGEGWCLPAIDSMGFRKQRVLPLYFTAIADDRCSGLGNNFIPVKCAESPCWFAKDAMSTIYNAKESWFDIDIYDAARAMRVAYLNGKVEKEVDMNHLSYESVGQKIMEALYGYRERNS